MSDYPSYPPPPPPEGYGGYGQPARAEPPASISTSFNIILGVLALSALSTVLSFVYLDELVEAANVDTAGIDLDAARSSAMIGAVIGFLVFGALWVLFGVFLRKGANWARIVLSILVALGLVFGLLGLSREQPVVFLLLSLAQLALYAALMYFMWRPESTAYLKGRQA
ncbi:MAG: hypothetical protein H0T14_00290 [Nocardioidaceae bacterium]|nr:hypothetical protein [Nocardioidaceae bacterium]